MRLKYGAFWEGVL